MNRGIWLLGNSTTSDQIIEIGPSYRPVAPKSAGWRTYVVDHATQSELRTKYLPMGVDVTAIESVDAVWAGGNLHDAVPAEWEGSFTRLIASHVIEHIPNFVAFFTSASRLLAADGTIALAVPDRRRCFDFFKPLTTTGDVVEAHRLQRSRHTSLTVWNQAAYSVTLNGAGSWDDEPVPDLAFSSSLAATARDYAAYTESSHDTYMDCHAWHFTPASFELVILELGQLGLIEWRVVELASLGGEFLCTLRRGVEDLDEKSLQHLRLRWLYRSLAEVRTQIDRALGAAECVLVGPDSALVEADATLGEVNSSVGEADNDSGEGDRADHRVEWGASRLLRSLV